MHSNDSGTHECPERQHASTTTTNCPECGGPLSGIDTRGRGRHEAEPCGCTVSDARLAGPRVMTDGGRENVAKVRVSSTDEEIDFDVQNGVLYLDFETQSAVESLIGFCATAMHGDSLRVEDVPHEDLTLDDLAPAFPFDPYEEDEAEVVADGGTAFADLHAFQRDALLVVRALEREGDAPPKGVAVLDELADRYGEALNHSRLYQNLDELVDRGLVEKGSHDDRTNAYATTSAARELLERRARAMQDAVAAADGGRDA